MEALNGGLYWKTRAADWRRWTVGCVTGMVLMADESRRKRRRRLCVILSPDCLVRLKVDKSYDFNVLGGVLEISTHGTPIITGGEETLLAQLK